MHIHLHGPEGSGKTALLKRLALDKRHDVVVYDDLDYIGTLARLKLQRRHVVTTGKTPVHSPSALNVRMSPIAAERVVELLKGAL